MSITRIIYLILAILGIVIPWYYNLQFFSETGLADFINESSSNLAAQSVSFDLFIATIAGSVWMYLESKRMEMNYIWLYIFAGLFVSFSFAFPFFLFIREGKLESLTDEVITNK